MGWVMHRSAIITVATLSAAVLFGLLSGAGLGVSDEILGTGIPVAMLLAAGQAYIAIALWKKYI